MELISTYAYTFTSRGGNIKSAQNWQLSHTRFEHDRIDRPFFLNPRNCFLIKANYFIPKSDSGEWAKKFYLIEPLTKLLPPDQVGKLIRITLIDSVRQLEKILDLMDTHGLEEIPYKPGLHWTMVIEIVIQHLLGLEKVEENIFKSYDYYPGQFKEIIYHTLKRKFFDEEAISKMYKSLTICLAPKKLEKQCFDDDDVEIQEYSKEEWDDMYRAAFENDPSNQWNHD